jgi:hypothetical protein
VVDMSARAVTARLREAARLLSGRGFVKKGVDMSASAITARLRAQGALSDMCRRLGPLRSRLRPHNTAPRPGIDPEAFNRLTDEPEDEAVVGKMRSDR